MSYYLAGGGVGGLVLIIIIIVACNQKKAAPPADPAAVAAAAAAAAAAASTSGSSSHLVQGQVIGQGQVGVEMPRFDVNTGLPLAPAGQGGTVAQLTELKRLLDTGVLSQAEFDAQKKMILAGPSVHA